MQQKKCKWKKRMKVRCILTKIHILYMLQIAIAIRVTVENLQEKVSVIE